MRIFVVFVFILMAGIHVANAQDFKESQLLLKGGLAMPLSRFGGSSFMPPAAELHPDGLAQKGVGVTVQYMRAINRKWGWTTELVYQTHAQQLKAIENNISNTWIYGAPASVEASGKRWNIFKFMAGGYYKNLIRKSSSWTIRPQLLLGITKTDLPGYSYFIYSNNSISSSGTQTNMPLKVALSYQMNLSMQCKLSPKYFAAMDLSYYHATPWMDYQYYPNFPQSFNLVTGKKRHYDLSTALIQVGLGMKL